MYIERNKVSEKKDWRSFSKLNTCEELTVYFEDREYTHGQYCHYTSLEVIELILKNKSFRLSCVERFNDAKEVEEIKDSRYKFSICFSTGINENLPLWYMYAGIDGRGCRIRFTKTFVRRLIDEAEYYLVELDEKGESIDGSEILLDDSKIISKQFKDIIYVDNQNNDLKYNTMTNHTMLHKEIDAYISQNNGFWKQIVWYYEKETRLLLEIDHDLIADNKVYAISMTIPDFIKYDIDLAPEADEESLKNNRNCPELWEYIESAHMKCG